MMIILRCKNNGEIINRVCVVCQNDATRKTQTRTLTAAQFMDYIRNTSQDDIGVCMMVCDANTLTLYHTPRTTQTTSEKESQNG